MIIRPTGHLTIVAALLTITVGLAACGGDAATRSGPEGTLNVYLYQKPKRFSPLDPANGPDQQVMQLVFDNLVTVNDEYDYEPRLAESWELSADGATWTFHLREGLKWSDGEPFTARDVVFTYTLLANPETGSAWSGTLADVKGVSEFLDGEASGIRGFKALDDSTFVIELTKPNVGFLSLLTAGFFILPQHVLGDVPLDQIADDEFFGKPTVGLGPYKFVTYKTDRYVHVTRNDNYRTPVKIKDMFLKPVTSDVATSQLGTGEMDLVQISPTDLETVRGMDGVEVESKLSPGFVRIALNLEDERFADPRVRQAMLYAVDRKTLVDKVLAGEGQVQNSVFVASSALPDDLNAYPYDPAKAKQLLTAAGWESQKPVTLSWIPGQRDRDAAATIVQSQLSAAGIDVKLKQVQVSELLDSYDKRSFDMALFGGGNYAVDPSSDTPIITCDAFYPDGGNIPHFCDRLTDRLMARANAETDEDERSALYQQAAARENREVSYMWLYNPNAIWARMSRLKGFKPTGDFVLGFWNAAEWSLGA